MDEMCILYFSILYLFNIDCILKLLIWNIFIRIYRNALEEEKSKSLNLSDLLESERETLWRVQAELEALKQQQVYADPRAIEVTFINIQLHIQSNLCIMSPRGKTEHGLNRHKRCCTFHYLSWTDSIKSNLQFPFILVWLLSRNKRFQSFYKKVVFIWRLPCFILSRKGYWCVAFIHTVVFILMSPSTQVWLYNYICTYINHNLTFILYLISIS